MGNKTIISETSVVCISLKVSRQRKAKCLISGQDLWKDWCVVVGAPALVPRHHHLEGRSADTGWHMSTKGGDMKAAGGTEDIWYFTVCDVLLSSNSFWYFPCPANYRKYTHNSVQLCNFPLFYLSFCFLAIVPYVVGPTFLRGPCLWPQLHSLLLAGHNYTLTLIVSCSWKEQK